MCARRLIGLRLWWVRMRAGHRKRAIFERGLRPRHPGGNARNRRQFWRHPQRHVLFERVYQ